VTPRDRKILRFDTPSAGPGSRRAAVATPVCRAGPLNWNRCEAAVGMLNVLRRDDGVIRHFLGAELLFAPTGPGQDCRHVDTIEPLWNLFDLTPEGRGPDCDEQLRYSCCAANSVRAPPVGWAAELWSDEAPTVLVDRFINYVTY
jgi:hypothetical protein